MGFNQVTLMGNLTRDPVRFGERTTCAEFTLAVNETRYDDQGNKLEDVYWAGCKAFGRSAETILQHVRKGSALLVTGKLTNDQWTDKETGKKQSKTRILVRSFQFAGARRDTPEPTRAQDGAPPPQSPVANDIPLRDDEVPF